MEKNEFPIPLLLQEHFPFNKSFGVLDDYQPREDRGDRASHLTVGASWGRELKEEEQAGAAAEPRKQPDQLNKTPSCEKKEGTTGKEAPRQRC